MKGRHSLAESSGGNPEWRTGAEPGFLMDKRYRILVGEMVSVLLFCRENSQNSLSGMKKPGRSAYTSVPSMGQKELE